MAKHPSFPNLKYFKPHEFDCPCGKCDGGAERMDYDLLLMLDQARAEARVPFVINSAYRCPEHNARVGGVRDSAHTLGAAVDIATLSSRARFAVLHALIMVGAERLGIGDTFIHVDVDDSKPDRVVWGY